jgi:hypothetical protein
MRERVYAHPLTTIGACLGAALAALLNGGLL